MDERKGPVSKAEERAEVEKLAQAVGNMLEQSKVLIRERRLYDDVIGLDQDPFFDLIVIAPAFRDLDFEERLNMIWPAFINVPDWAFKKILGVDCVTPREYHPRVE
jgi:hypothetical protein